MGNTTMTTSYDYDHDHDERRASPFAHTDEVRLARDFLAAFAPSCRLHPHWGNMLIAETLRADTPFASYSFVMIPPSPEYGERQRRSENKHRPPRPPRAQPSWLLVAMHVCKTQVSTIHVYTIDDSLPDQSRGHAHNAVQHAFPAASAVRQVAAHNYQLLRLPPARDSSSLSSDSAQFIQCVGIAACLITGVKMPERLVLQVWRDAISAISEAGEMEVGDEISLLLSTGQARSQVIPRQSDNSRQELEHVRDMKQQLELILECVESSPTGRTDLAFETSFLADVDEKISLWHGILESYGYLDVMARQMIRKYVSERDAAKLRFVQAKRLELLKAWAKRGIAEVDRP